MEAFSLRFTPKGWVGAKDEGSGAERFVPVQQAIYLYK